MITARFILHLIIVINRHTTSKSLSKYIIILRVKLECKYTTIFTNQSLILATITNC
jgi:hypothetical protein